MRGSSLLDGKWWPSSNTTGYASKSMYRQPPMNCTHVSLLINRRELATHRKIHRDGYQSGFSDK